MTVDLLGLVAAAAGGFLGASFGAVIVFVITGIAVLIGAAALIGSGDPTFLNDIAFGPLLGPHIGFAAGVAAAAYAAKRGYLKDGRDIISPLMGLAKPSVLVVGALFGVFGYLVRALTQMVPWYNLHTDGVAFSVIVSAILVRVIFGSTGIIGPHVDGLTGWKRFTPNAQHVWLAFQQSPLMALLLGLFAGGGASYAAIVLLDAFPDAKGLAFVGFGISATSLIFMATSMAVPATHHITLVAGVATSVALGAGWGDTGALITGVIVGGLTGLCAEAFSRFWLIRGDTHIDPPTSAIWFMSTVVLGLGALIGIA